MDVFDPMINPTGTNKAEKAKWLAERRKSYWSTICGDNQTYAQVILFISEQIFEYWKKYWVRDEALKEIEIDPRMNNVTSKALN
jgi:hypothetical protein